MEHFDKICAEKVHDHHVEANFNQFYQFIYDDATLKNKKKCQDFGIKCADQIFLHNNDSQLSFRRALCIKSDKLAKLAEK